MQKKKKKHFHVDAKSAEWETWRRVASFRYKPDGKKCFEVLKREYEKVRFCIYVKCKLFVLKIQGGDLDPTGEVEQGQQGQGERVGTVGTETVGTGQVEQVGTGQVGTEQGEQGEQGQGWAGRAGPSRAGGDEQDEQDEAIHPNEKP